MLCSTITAEEDVCKPLDSVADFDLAKYVSKTWYSHEQAENRYSPISDNYCVRAEYDIRSNPTFWFGYTVDVRNRALRNNEEERKGDLCAYQTDLDSDPPRSSKLAVAPCFLPKFFSGPYWVVAYDEGEGYALISGGAPTIPSYDDNDGTFLGCRTGTGVNNSGLWIFTRSYVRDEDLINKVRGIAQEKGFDLSVLNIVDHTDCGYPPITPSPSDSPSYAIAPSASPTRVVSSTPTVSGFDNDCKDSDEEFWFFGTRDCSWVTDSFRCFFFSNRCPDTCGMCD